MSEPTKEIQDTEPTVKETKEETQVSSSEVQEVEASEASEADTKELSTDENEEEDDTSTQSEIIVPISRKRTRDDYEEPEDAKQEKVEERPIAPLKRRKDETENVEESKDNEEKREKDKSEEKPKEDTKETKEVSVPEEQKDPEPTKPKFVFGSTTSFGANDFSMLNNKTNVFSPSSTNTTITPTSSTPSVSVFGSSSTFGNAFQNAIKKESIFDKEPSNEKKDEEHEAKENNLYKQVDLEKQDIKSGEENEEQVFTCRSKLYALDLTNVKLGWKERGVGNIHVNKSLSSDSKSRIIMRSNGLLKVILNTALVSGLEVVKGMPSSLSSEKFIRITSVEEGKPIQYALKTGNVETRDKLFDSIKGLIPEAV